MTRKELAACRPGDRRRLEPFKNPVHHFPMHVRESVLTAFGLVCELSVINSQARQNRGRIGASRSWWWSRFSTRSSPYESVNSPSWNISLERSSESTPRSRRRKGFRRRKHDISNSQEHSCLVRPSFWDDTRRQTLCCGSFPFCSPPFLEWTQHSSVSDSSSLCYKRVNSICT